MNCAGTCSKTKNKIDISSSNLRKLTTFAVCLTPILCIYRFLGMFMLGEVVLILLLFANIIATWHENKIICHKQGIIALFAFCIFFVSCLGYFINGIDISVLPRLVRLLFCLIAAALLGEYFYDYRIAKKYILFIAVVATVLIVFQKCYHDITGEFIYFISKENIYSSIYNEYYFQNVESLSTYRPMSVFLEPSHYCQYVLFALAIVLFKHKMSVKDILLAAFLSVGILVSTSSMGVILCLTLWAVYLFTIMKDFVLSGRLNLKIFFIILIVIISAVMIFSQFGDMFWFAIQRIYNPSVSSSTAAWDSRLGTFSVFFETDNLRTLLFGRGYGVINEGEWYASIPYYYSGTGILGILAIAVLFVVLYCLSDKLQRKLLILLFVLCFTTEVLTNYWLIFILPLIMKATEDKGIKSL